jgi:hypothetical protein
MLFSASNKEEIVSLQRFLEAQEREEKVKKNHQKLALYGARKMKLGARLSACCAMAQGKWSKAQKPQMAAPWRKETAPARGKNPIN